MTVQDTIKNLREKHGLSQDQLAERVMVTRQAVSRWETGETQPNTDTLQLLSKEFDVSINTLLGNPRQPDGSFNEDFCKWCYADGKFAYKSKDSLLDYLVGHMPNPDNLPDDKRRTQYDGYLSQLKHWK